MTEDSITRQLVKSLYSSLGRFVSKLNEDLGTGTEAPAPATGISPLDKGWTYRKGDEIGIRERYDRDCI